MSRDEQVGSGTAPLPQRPLRFVFLGLSITSSWGNGHATTYRGLVRELARQGHDVLFLERDQPWYAEHRDLPEPPWGRTQLYSSPAELSEAWEDAVRCADAVIVGSYVPDGQEVGRWATSTARGCTAFYDIDTPVTLAALERGDCAYLSNELIARFDLYLSFTGGPMLRRLEERHGARKALPLYCSFDPDSYYPANGGWSADLCYLGTYSADRQPKLDSLLLEPARRWPGGRFAVAGPQYPDDAGWPDNVVRISHLAPPEHRAFYAAHRFTLNVTRDDMVAAGWSPSVRLFEAAGCGVPVISDAWEGLEDFFEPGREILIAEGPGDALSILRGLGEPSRQRIAQAAHARARASHTAAHRARELVSYVRG